MLAKAAALRSTCGPFQSTFDPLKRLQDTTMQHPPWLYATQRPRR